MDYENIAISFVTTILGIFVALILDRGRMPKIEIIVSKSANDEITYNHGPYLGQRWKFFRVIVRNKKMPWLLRWLIRQSAENCRASITITEVSNTKTFTYKGRWASTPEVPYYQQSAVIKIFEPDPVIILAGESEILDVVAKYENDIEAYGWNNESYFNNWRTPNYRLTPGRYKVQITVFTQNGISSKKDFIFIVGNTIEESDFA